MKGYIEILIGMIILLLAMDSCAVTIPNTKVCAVAGVMEAGMDCVDTLDNTETTIAPKDIRGFLEAIEEVDDPSGNVLQAPRGPAICESMADWGLEHAALEAACQKLGAACTYDIRQQINNVTAKVNALTALSTKAQTK